MKLGEIIAAEIRRKGMTKAEFGRRVGTSRQNVNTLLKRDSFDSDFLVRVSKLLEHDFFQYLDRPHAPKPNRGKETPTMFLLVEIPPDYFDKVKPLIPRQ